MDVRESDMVSFCSFWMFLEEESGGDVSLEEHKCESKTKSERLSSIYVTSNR